MQIRQLSNNNFNNYSIKQNQPFANKKEKTHFQGYGNAGSGSKKSNFFKPITAFINKKMDKPTSYIAKGLGYLLGKKSFETLVKKTDSKWLISHLSAFTSVILSGFYMKKTLENENLDKNKRTTLAINQGAVALVSMFVSYCIEGITNKPFNKFINKFERINAGNENLGRYVEGIRAAKSIMIFGTIYRFIAPVFVTPLANKIGNDIQAKREAKLAIEKQKMQKA